MLGISISERIASWEEKKARRTSRPFNFAEETKFSSSQLSRGRGIERVNEIAFKPTRPNAGLGRVHGWFSVGDGCTQGRLVRRIRFCEMIQTLRNTPGFSTLRLPVQLFVVQTGKHILSIPISLRKLAQQCISIHKPSHVP